MFNNTNNNDNKNKKKIITIISIIIIVIILLLLLMRCSSDGEVDIPSFSVSNEEEDWTGQQNRPQQAEQEYMEIPYYGTLYVSEEEPYVWFNNPATNNVYFSYQVLLDGEELFHNEEYISPGKALKAKLYGYLDKGDYTITVNISAIDQNGAACNGATQEAKLVVQ